MIAVYFCANCGEFKVKVQSIYAPYKRKCRCGFIAIWDRNITHSGISVNGDPNKVPSKDYKDWMESPDTQAKLKSGELRPVKKSDDIVHRGRIDR